jgi:hypothetical protein
MPRALDHIVIACRDLAAVAERYRQLGFKVGACNRHPWGTENHIIQFDGAFLELVGRGEGFQGPPPDDPVFPFAGFLDDFLNSREGLAMLVLRSGDAEADRQTFAKKGLGDRPRFDFARKGRRGGREVEVAFSLAFAHAEVFPQTGFFVCQQRFPENFWDAAAQVHPNGATGVVELAFVHRQPDAAAGFLSAFLDAPSEATPGGLQFALDGARITCVRSTPPALDGLASMRIATADGSSFWVD